MVISRRVDNRAYRTVKHVLTGISALLDVTFQCTGIQWFQKLETAQQIARNRHDSTPIVKFSAVLRLCQYKSNPVFKECSRLVPKRR
jgi:hypothetical protein